MRKLTIIAAVAKNNIIGKDGLIPWNTPDEMELFKKTTMGHSVIMGRKTFESIGKELPGRKNIVLSRAGHYNSIEKALQECEDEDAFVIGGASVYAQMMPFSDELLISHMKNAYEGDCCFPDINGKIWRIAEQQEFPDFIHTKYTRI